MRVLLLVTMSFMVLGCAKDHSKSPDAGAGSGATGGMSGVGGSSDAGGTGGSGASGGTGGAGGVAGTGGSGGAPDGPECQDNEDCVLGGGCCDCWAVPVGEERGTCRANCEQDLCAVHGIEAPACNRGRCELPVSCNRDHAACVPAPECPDGQTAMVRNGCYGPCVDVVDCLQVTNCADCGSGQACIEQCRGLVQCVEVPASCNGRESCDCLGEHCEQPPFCLGWDASERKLSCACEAG